MRNILFGAMLGIAISAHAWTQLPSKHLVCDKGTDAYGFHDVDVNCRLEDGPAPDPGFKLPPADPKEIVRITKDNNGDMTIERRDGSCETFKLNALGGWDRYN